MSARRIHRVLIVVLLLAGTAVLLAEYFGVRQSAPPVRPQVARSNFTLVEARRNLARGAVIQPGDIAARPSEEAPPPGTLTRLADATGRVTTEAIAVSEPVSEANSAPAEELRLANLVPPGMRAVALRVSEETAVANLVRPGDRVDVLMTTNPVKSAVEGRSFANAEARIVLQNILVLAVGDVTAAAEEMPEAVRNVTLAVSPREAAMVALIRSVGTEYLSLRAKGDEIESKVPPVLTGDLRTEAAPTETARAVAPARPAGRVVEIISGASSNKSRVAVGSAQ